MCSTVYHPLSITLSPISHSPTHLPSHPLTHSLVSAVVVVTASMIRALNLQEQARANLAHAPGAATSPGARARASSSPTNQRVNKGPDGGIGKVVVPGQGEGGVGVGGLDESVSLMSADILGMGTEAGRGAGEVKTGDAGSKVAFASGQGLEEGSPCPYGGRGGGRRRRLGSQLVARAAVQVLAFGRARGTEQQ